MIKKDVLLRSEIRTVFSLIIKDIFLLKTIAHENIFRTKLKSIVAYIQNFKLANRNVNQFMELITKIYKHAKNNAKKSMINMHKFYNLDIRIINKDFKCKLVI